MRGPGSALRDWPLGAREAELDVLASVVASGDTRRAEPAGAVVVAAAGVGKSRLLRGALDRAEVDGHRTFLAIATRSAGTTPYAALAHLAPEVSIEQHDDPSSWFHAFAQALAPDGRRPVLAVDDAHLLDPGSAGLLLHLGLTGAATVLVTVRRGESVLDPITTLWKDGLADRIDLQPLSHAEMCGVIDAGLDHAVSRRTCDRLARVSSGNLLFARELVRGAMESGSLARHDGVWRWDEKVVLAPRLVDTVSQRLGDLSDLAREALGLVALGEPLTNSAAQALLDVDTLVGLERSGLVVIDDEGTCRIGHPLYGDVVVADLGRARVGAMRRKLIDTLDGADRADSDVVRLATWRLDLGIDADPELLTEAAKRANQAFDHALAGRLAKAAYDDGGAPCAAVEYAWACTGRDRFADAEQVLADAEDLVLATPDIELHQRYLASRHTALYMGLGRRDETEAMLARFVAAHEGAEDAHGRQARALAAAYQSQIALDDGRLAEVVAMTAATLSDPAAGGSFPTMVSLETSAEALAYAGDMATARDLHERLGALGASGGPEVQRAAATGVLQSCLCLSLEGQLTEALQIARQIRDWTVQDPDPRIRSLVALVLGGIELQRGTCRTARRTLQDAVEGFTTTDSGGAASWSAALLAQAEALCGNAVQAQEALARSRSRRLGRPIARMKIDFSLAEAYTRAVSGDATGAARVALAEVGGLGELRIPRARLLHRAACLGAPAGPIAAELQELAAETDVALVGTLAEHARALVAKDGGALACASTRFEETGMLLSAAEASAQAARSHRTAGSSGDARRAAARARRLVADCEGARTPALVDLDADPVSLSRREHEVAGLAARGMGNADIADHLVLSVRTVESHLYQAFAKLGVERREDLNGALRLRAGNNQ